MLPGVNEIFRLEGCSLEEDAKEEVECVKNSERRVTSGANLRSE